MLTTVDAFLVLMLALHIHKRDAKVKQCAQRIYFICEPEAQEIVKLVLIASMPCEMLKHAINYRAGSD